MTTRANDILEMVTCYLLQFSEPELQAEIVQHGYLIEFPA